MNGRNVFHLLCEIPLCGVLWPSGLVCWTLVLVWSECGFESQPVRSRRLWMLQPGGCSSACQNWDISNDNS